MQCCDFISVAFLSKRQFLVDRSYYIQVAIGLCVCIYNILSSGHISSALTLYRFNGLQASGNELDTWPAKQTHTHIRIIVKYPKVQGLRQRARLWSLSLFDLCRLHSERGNRSLVSMSARTCRLITNRSVEFSAVNSLGKSQCKPRWQDVGGISIIILMCLPLALVISAVKHSS